MNPIFSIFTYPRPQKTLLFLMMVPYLLLQGCAEPLPDEEQIEQVISEISNAVESKDTKAIGTHFHKNFRTHHGMDIMQLKRMLTAYGLQHNRLSVTIISSETILDPVYNDKAESTLSVVTTGSVGHIPNDGSVRVVDIEWIKEGDDWQLLKARW